MDIIKRNGTFLGEIPFSKGNAEKVHTGEIKGIVTYNGLDLKVRILATDIVDNAFPIVVAIMGNAGTERIMSITNTGGVKGESSYLHIYVQTSFKTYEKFIPHKYQPCLVRLTTVEDLWHAAVCSGYDENNKPLFFGYGKDMGFEFLPLCEVTFPLHLTHKSWEEYIEEQLKMPTDVFKE